MPRAVQLHLAYPHQQGATTDLGCFAEPHPIFPPPLRHAMSDRLQLRHSENKPRYIVIVCHLELHGGWLVVDRLNLVEEEVAQHRPHGVARIEEDCEPRLWFCRRIEARAEPEVRHAGVYRLPAATSSCTDQYSSEATTKQVIKTLASTTRRTVRRVPSGTMASVNQPTLPRHHVAIPPLSRKSSPGSLLAEAYQTTQRASPRSSANFWAAACRS